MSALSFDSGLDLCPDVRGKNKEGVGRERDVRVSSFKKELYELWKTSRQKWIKFLEEQTYGKVQEYGEQQASHVHDTQPFETGDRDFGKKASLSKEELTQMWREEDRETKKVQDFKVN